MSAFDSTIDRGVAAAPGEQQRYQRFVRSLHDCEPGLGQCVYRHSEGNMRLYRTLDARQFVSVQARRTRGKSPQTDGRSPGEESWWAGSRTRSSNRDENSAAIAW